MSIKFFTNSSENTLPEKFKRVFTYTKVAAFDALVGYFRSSGYFLIRDYLKNVNNIRILVGINVDNLITEAARKGLEFKFNANETRDEFFFFRRNERPRQFWLTVSDEKEKGDARNA